MLACRVLSVRSLAVVGIALGTFLVACSSNQSRSGFDETSKDGTTPDDQFGNGDDDDGDGPKAACTGDLQGVINRDGTVTPCEDGKGCAAGKCVAACEAAAASKGSLGCRYRVATPAFYAGYNTACFAVFIANGWQGSATVKVTRDGKAYDVSEFGRIAEAGVPESSWDPVPSSGIPAGKVAVLFLQGGTSSSGEITGREECPVDPAIRTATGLSATGQGKAWAISSDVPVTAYDIMPYGGASSFLPSAELLIPVTAWGTNYLAVLPPPSNRSSGTGQAWGQIVAAQDDTTVTIVSPVALPSASGVPAVKANTPTEVTLNADEFVQWEGSADLSGAVIQSDKPVAFTGGNTYLCYSSMTSTGGGCDSGHQQIPPVSALGSEYAVVPYASRTTTPESIRYRIVGGVDDTKLTYEPAVPGAPKTLKSGQIFDFETTSAFVVTSQDDAHPFYVGQTMAGGMMAGSSSSAGATGDEEFVNLLPPAQFLNGYLFFTDPTYTTTSLTVTRAKNGKGDFSDVEIDCVGKLSGFEPVGSGDKYESTTVTLVGTGAASSKCKNGPHTITSDGPVGVTVWGLASWASYAYPAGGSTAPINTVVVAAKPH